MYYRNRIFSGQSFFRYRRKTTPMQFILDSRAPVILSLLPPPLFQPSMYTFSPPTLLQFVLFLGIDESMSLSHLGGKKKKLAISDLSCLSFTHSFSPPPTNECLCSDTAVAVTMAHRNKTSPCMLLTTDVWRNRRRERLRMLVVGVCANALLVVRLWR